MAKVTRGAPEAPGELEVVPGCSIGPARLGMTAAEFEALAIASSLELRVEYGPDGRCCRITGLLPLSAEHPPIYRLAGQVLNGIDCQPAQVLFDSLGDDQRRDRGALSVPGLGVELCKWELTDDFYTAITVTAPLSV